MKYATNAFYCEYVKRMFNVIDQMKESMPKGGEKYFPDILKESSNVIISILKDLNIEIPEYVKELSYSDYFGNMVIGRYAINKIKTAWETEPDMFEIDKKKNRLIYRVPEKSSYELKNLQDELPPMLEIERTGTRLVMKLDKANEVFGIKFKKGFFDSLIPKKSVG